MEFTVTAAVLSLILSAATGEPVERGELLDTLARRDVVFLGEEHQSEVCHRLQLEIVKGLHQRRSDLVISMEMFERDVQGVLDDYLRGRIDEETFLEHARPWPNYAEHYRPIIEFARAEGLDVIAANAPRPLARKTSRGAFDSVADHPDVAREVFTEERAYRELFFEAMGDHAGVDSDGKTANFYLAQCLKDDTMAESMVEYRRLRPHRRPLIVHLCGRFHSDFGLGTVSRLLRRQPLWLVGVLSTISTPNVEAYTPSKEDREFAHYLMVVREEKKEKKDAEEKPASPQPVADAPSEAIPADAKATAPSPSEPTVPASPPSEADAPPEAAPPARPALGIMPDYGAADPGVAVDSVRENGPAATAGITAGDRIIGLDGEKIRSLQDYMDVMEGLTPGDVVEVILIRAGERHTLELKLGKSHR